jgi:hypothetical protein
VIWGDGQRTFFWNHKMQTGREAALFRLTRRITKRSQEAAERQNAVEEQQRQIEAQSRLDEERSRQYDEFLRREEEAQRRAEDAYRLREVYRRAEEQEERARHYDLQQQRRERRALERLWARNSLDVDPLNMLYRHRIVELARMGTAVLGVATNTAAPGEMVTVITGHRSIVRGNNNGFITGSNTVITGRRSHDEGQNKLKIPPTEDIKYDTAHDVAKDGKDSAPCVICLTNTARCKTVRCNHTVFCVGCTQNPLLSRLCPVCRQEMTEIVRL